MNSHNFGFFVQVQVFFGIKGFFLDLGFFGGDFGIKLINISNYYVL